MAIAFVSSSVEYGGVPLPLPAGAAVGMLLICGASTVNTSGVTPTIPAGFTPLEYPANGTLLRVSIGWRWIDGTETDCGTWTGGTRCNAMMYSGVDPTTPFGAEANYSAGANQFTLPALTPNVTDNTSWWLGFCANRNGGSTTPRVLPAGTTRETLPQTHQLVTGDSNGGFTSFAGATGSATGSANMTIGYIVELIAASGASPITGDAIVPVTVDAAAVGSVGISGAVSAAITIGVSAQGSVAVQGAAQAAVSVDASAAGQPLVSGAAQASIDIGLLSGGAVLLTGSAAAAIDIGLTSQGSVSIAGYAAAAVLVDLAGDGSASISGSSGANFIIGLTASDSVPDNTGAATVAISVGLQAAGLSPVSGAAQVAIDAEASSAGIVSISGTFAGSISVDGSAAGQVGISGAGAVAISVGLSSRGSARASGIVLAPVVVDLSAFGYPGDVAPARPRARNNQASSIMLREGFGPSRANIKSSITRIRVP